MMHWLRHLFGRTANRKERSAQAAENNVERMEDQAIVQQERLAAASRRVSGALAQVKRVEDLARRKGGP
jgi:hypothetical protein